MLFLIGASTAALTSPGQLASRRAAVFGGLASMLTPPLAAVANDPIGVTGREGGALAATCLGFGCNPYGNPGFNGMAKEAAPPGSIPYSDFLAAVKDKKVEGVVFEPPSGDVAYAIIDGKSVRIGEGWPIEVSNSWSSPTWVVRILENENVPYAWNFNLKAKNKVRTSAYGRTPPSAWYQRGPRGACRSRKCMVELTAIAGPDTNDYGNLK